MMLNTRRASKRELHPQRLGRRPSASTFEPERAEKGAKLARKRVET
jgi:hypothetical protein